MDDTEDMNLIAKQAVKIDKLELQVESARQCLEKIHRRIYRIGGPLNDNVDGYTHKQFSIFFDMSKDIENCDIAIFND